MEGKCRSGVSQGEFEVYEDKVIDKKVGKWKEANVIYADNVLESRGTNEMRNESTDWLKQELAINMYQS